LSEFESTPVAAAADDPWAVRYAGLVTRAVALAIDLLAANAIFSLIGGALGLIAAAFGDNSGLSAVEVAIGAVLWWIWLVAYFVVFWTLTGQTLGNRVLGIRVVRATGGTVTIRQGLVRVAAFVLAAIPLGAGFLPVLVDQERRGLHDRIAKTVVVWTDEPPEVPAAEAERVAAALETDAGAAESDTAAGPTDATTNRGPGSAPGPQIPRIS
jgi:uncharacterized RDD family membrane protein YckC